MSARLHDDLRLLRGEGPSQAGAPSDRLFPTLAVLAVGAVLVGMVSLCSGGHAMRAIPEQQRAALLSHTLGELKQFCGEGRPDTLKDHCRELASFAAQFDECNGECVTLVRRDLTPVPTR